MNITIEYLCVPYPRYRPLFIIPNNRIYNHHFIYISGSTPLITYSDIENGWEGEGNIDANPLFNWDFTLQENSPFIDAGTADLDGDGIDDISGYFVIAPDMGAFEW